MTKQKANRIITLSKVGYNHPSQANWSYGIWKVDTIDTQENYCASYTTKENFGGDSRFKSALKEKNIKVIETQPIYTKTGTQKITGISTLENLDSEQFIKKIELWATK